MGVGVTDLRRNPDVDQSALNRLLKWATREVRRVAKAYGISPGAVVGECKWRPATDARAEVVRSLRAEWVQSRGQWGVFGVTFREREPNEELDEKQWAPLSTTVIGFVVGRHHTVVRYLLKREVRA